LVKATAVFLGVAHCRNFIRDNGNWRDSAHSILIVAAAAHQ
jgi:hypothetical protein